MSGFKYIFNVIHISVVTLRVFASLGLDMQQTVTNNQKEIHRLNIGPLVFSLHKGLMKAIHLCEAGLWRGGNLSLNEEANCETVRLCDIFSY